MGVVPLSASGLDAAQLSERETQRERWGGYIYIYLSSHVEMRQCCGSGRGRRRWFTRAALRLLTQLDAALLRLVLHVHLVFAAHPAHGAPGTHDTPLNCREHSLENSNSHLSWFCFFFKSIFTCALGFKDVVILKWIKGSEFSATPTCDVCLVRL